MRRVNRLLPLCWFLLALDGAAAGAQSGSPMTPERLDDLTQQRTMTLRARGPMLSHVTPGLTQQMLYRIRLGPETADLPMCVFCSGARLSEFDHAMTALFGYRLVGRAQGEGMGLVFVPDPAAVSAAERQRLQGQAAVEAGIARALDWIQQPEALGTIARTRCPAAGELKEAQVQRAFRLHAALSRSQRAVVLAGHPVVLPYAALPARSRKLLPPGKPAPKWLAFYLYQNPWSPDSQPRLAVRAEPSGQTWLSAPPLALVPAHAASTRTSDPALKQRLKGKPDLEDLEPGEEAPAILEWLAEQTKLWIMSEGLRLPPGGAAQLKSFATGFNDLTLDEGLDRAAAFFGATWRLDGGWVLLQRRTARSG